MGTRYLSWFAVIALLLTMGLLGSCGDDSPTSRQSSTARDSVGTVTVGGTLPLSGQYSDTGWWIERGYRYWAEEVNAKGGLLGRKVSLRIEDDGGNVDLAVSLFEQLISQHRVDLLLGGYPGTVAAMQMPSAERHRMVYVSMGGHMPSFEQGFTYSFGGPPLLGEWWYQGFWEWFATLPPIDRPRSAAMISVNNRAGLAIRESALEGAAQQGIAVVMDELYDLPLTRAEELVAKARHTGADLFVASGFLPDGVLTKQAMKSLGYHPAYFLQGVGSLVPRWKEELGSDGDFVFSGTPLHPKLPFHGVKELSAMASRQFGVSEVPSYFLFGYAWLQTLQRGVEGAGSLDQTAIRDYLRTHPVETIAGTFRFDERGLPKPYNYLTQVQPSGVEIIWPLEVQTAEPILVRSHNR